MQITDDTVLTVATCELEGCDQQFTRLTKGPNAKRRRFCCDAHRQKHFYHQRIVRETETLRTEVQQLRSLVASLTRQLQGESGGANAQ